MVCRNIFHLALLALATYLISCLAPSGPALAQSRPAVASAIDENSIKFRMNQWTVGLAAGLPDGGFVRFVSEMARTMDDGDNMRMIPMVTRGTTTNIPDLLYLKGVDVAITYADAFDFYSKQAGLSNINDRIRYIMQFFVSDIHIYTRDEFKSLADLKGQKVAVGTSGVAAALTGPLIFKRLGIDIQTVPVGGPIALEQLHKGQIAAMVYVAAKPSELFAGMKPDPGYHFLPVPYTKEFTDYYYPSTLKTEDYPTFLPPGTSIQTIAVPSVLAVYNWKQGSDRGERVNRFVEALFNNFARLQKPPFHPKWKDVNLAATVPGWKRYPFAEVALERLKEAKANAETSAADEAAIRQQRFGAMLDAQEKAPLSDAKKDEMYREFQEWRNSRQPPK
jgi:TRAP-type uncharacterized transport system substrate-binding protein